jgi:hypothetical protein
MNGKEEAEEKERGHEMSWPCEREFGKTVLSLIRLMAW